jgi:vitamin B12 transporter
VSESRREDLFDDPGDPFGPFFQNTDSRSRRARVTTRTRTGFGTLVAGAEYENIVVDDVTNFGPNFLDKERTERSLFVEDRYSHNFGTSRVELSAGARFDDYETFGSELSPRLATAWIVGRNKYRAAYGEAFRAPYVGELFSPFGGNPDLRAERSRSVEIGVDHSIGTGGLASLTLFHDRYRDLITNAGFVLANVGRARSQGAELFLQGQLSKTMNAGLTYTYTDAKNLDTSEALLRRPEHSGSAFVSVRHGITQLNAILVRTGERPDILPVLPFSRTTNDAHTTLDVNLQVDLGRFTPYVKLENATGTDYQEVLGYPSPARRAIVGVRFGG